MIEMQSIRKLHCTIWTEGIKEIVSANDSKVKFILSDHPVTIYNHDCQPENKKFQYPNDPSTLLIGSQTIFPLDMNNCLIITNYEYAKHPNKKNSTKKRINPKQHRTSIARTDNIVRKREFDSESVEKINFIIKKRAKKFVAATEKEWLYPREFKWKELKELLLPPMKGIWHHGGEMFIGYDDGSTHYQDAYGRTSPENKFLKKKINPKLGSNDYCGCGSGKKYKKCCSTKKENERPSWEVLSMRERNLFFIDSIIKIIGLSESYTWDDVRKNLDDTQIKEIYSLLDSLWNSDTDLIAMLPKPDDTLRTLYTGVIDPRVISNTVLNLCLYFDEVIVINPFIFPCDKKTEFNPIENPHNFKQETLKNISLLFMLQPFIEAGYINLIPNPTNFNHYLHKQMLEMSKSRVISENDIEKDKKKLDFLWKQDYERTIYTLNKKNLTHHIYKMMPNATEKDVINLLSHFELQRRQDPLALLQEDVMEKKGGQYIIQNMSPNYEISLYLSQLTGSILVTDSYSRWNEIKQSQYREHGLISYSLSIISQCIESCDFKFIFDSEYILNARDSSEYNELRRTLNNVYISVLSKHSVTILTKHLEDFKKIYKLISDKPLPKYDNYINSNWKCIIPDGGISDLNIQRMIIESGSENHFKTLPIAIFIETENFKREDETSQS